MHPAIDNHEIGKSIPDCFKCIVKHKRLYFGRYDHKYMPILFVGNKNKRLQVLSISNSYQDKDDLFTQKTGISKYEHVFL